MTLPATREAALIARHFAPLATDPGAVGLTDDAAVVRPPPGHDLVVTTDAIAARIHFLDDPPDAIARKALRVNLSDLAAKGAAPFGYLLSLGLADGWTDDFLAGFAAGLAADQAEYGVSLLGGDTIRTVERLTVAVTAIGTLPAGTMVRRAGARPGDVLFVTGTIGDAALGVAMRYNPALAGRLGLAEPHRRHLAERNLLPQPRTGIAAALRTHARAALDVSDGLVGDAAKLSGGGARVVIDAAAVPLSEAGRRAIAADPALLKTVLTGGDDFEIVAAVPPDAAEPFAADCADAGVAVTAIGRIDAGDGVAIEGLPEGIDLGTGGFAHY
jgi:thiamine-monophosphate kinase